MAESLQLPDRKELERKYEANFPLYEQILDAILVRLRERLHIQALYSTIKYRVKSFPSYYRKKIKFLKQAKSEKKTRPFPITDVLGIRLICPFMEDLARAEDALQNEFKIVEIERKGADYSFKEFGYESVHVLIEIPESLRKKAYGLDINVCEVQIRTILQDAWAEVEHELVYKAEFSPFDEPMKRKLAALNANLTLSDIIFQEIRDYQHQLNTELAKRRADFYLKIESTLDTGIFPEGSQLGTLDTIDQRYEPKGSIDEMLLEALHAHNSQDFKRAIGIYTTMLEMKPDNNVLAIIFKHRGMAYFAESRYKEALEDFKNNLEYEPQCYKSAYYAGISFSVLKEYQNATDWFSRAISINPYHFYSHYRKAQAEFHLGDYPEALGDCENALKLEPESIEAGRFKEVILARFQL